MGQVDVTVNILKSVRNLNRGVAQVQSYMKVEFDGLEASGV